MSKTKSKHSASFEMPTLLVEFATWLEEHDEHAVGYFERTDDPPGEGHFATKEEEARFLAKALSFARTPDGSEIVLIAREQGLPCPVVYLNSEGGEQTIATSPEDFLLLLAKAETGISDLDDEEASERKALSTWLKKKKVKGPKAPAFDLGAFLEGKDGSGAAGSTEQARLPPPPSGEVYAKLPERARRLALLVGRPASDPELAAFVTSELGKKIPASLSWSNDSEWVEASKKHGIDLIFYAHVYHDAYPEIPKSKTSFVPYLAAVYFRAGYPDPLPFGVNRQMDNAALASLMGAPLGIRPKGEGAYWHCPIDGGRGVIFDVRGQGQDQYSLRIDVAMDLWTGTVQSVSAVGLFIAWALQRDLLDVSRFPAHASLIARIKNRQEKGSALVKAALARGLWGNHLVPVPGLDRFAFGWFKNIGGKYIRDDLVAVFGGRQGKYGHQEPVLDDDPWTAVDQATGKLDSTFAEWLKRS